MRLPRGHAGQKYESYAMKSEWRDREKEVRGNGCVMIKWGESERERNGRGDIVCVYRSAHTSGNGNANKNCGMCSGGWQVRNTNTTGPK